MFCLLVYTANQTVIRTTTISTPSVDQYRDLYRNQESSLSCPCSTITSEYQHFLTIVPELHQLCSSDFVQEIWLNYTNTIGELLYVFDFRRSASLIFHALASYCSLSNRTIFNDITAFQSTELISTEVLSETFFHAKTTNLISDFTQSTRQRFAQYLQFIRTMTYGNQLINGMTTNFIIVFVGPNLNGAYLLFSTPNFVYSSCHCDSSSFCSSKAGIYNLVNQTEYNVQLTIPGMLIGCYTNEALQESTLECLFNQTCVDTMKFYLNFTTSLDITALNSSIRSQFSPIVTINQLLSNLMVDRWIWEDSYVNYYELCKPASCSYKLTVKTPLIVILTTLIGLFGGLVKILQMLVPFVVKSVRRRKTPATTEEEHLRKYWKRKISKELKANMLISSFFDV